MKVRQTWIFGIILVIAGIGTLSVSILFLLSANNQLISVRVFDRAFEDAWAINSTSPDYIKFFAGDHGFRLREVVPLPSHPPPQFHGEGFLQEGDQVPPSRLEEYLKSTPWYSLLVRNAFGPDAGVKCYIPRFRDAGIFGLVGSLLQLIVSLLYIFWKEKNIRTMSTFFYSYFFIFLTHLACLCIVLNGKPNRLYQHLAPLGYSRTKSDVFASVLGLNCVTLLGLTLLTCLTCNTEEYSDRCIDEDTSNRKRTGSGANILSASNAASTDRLNNK